ncbi:MAG TPA: insulinase family protein [Armatimonadota bacterium]
MRAAPVVSSLRNGFRVVANDEPESDRVAVLLMVRAGDADDPPDAPGAARVLGRILIEPANHRSPGRFPLMAVEGDVRVVTEGDVTTFTAVTTRAQAATAIRLLAAFIETPVWNNTTLIRAVKRNGEEDRDEAPTDWQRDFEIWQSRLGLDVPAPPLPDLPPRDTLRSLFESCYKAHSMVLCASGDLRGLNVSAEAENWFGGLPRVADTVVRRHRAHDTPHRNPSNTFAFAGYRAPAATDGLAPAMEVISAAMGLGKTSAIFRTLRDVEGTGYESGAVYPRRLAPGAIALFSRAPGQSAKVRDDLASIWKSAALDTRTDWGSARARAVQLYASRHQTARDRAYWLAFWELAGNGAAYDAEYSAAMRSVADAALTAAARRWLSGPPVAIP